MGTVTRLELASKYGLHASIPIAPTRQADGRNHELPKQRQVIEKMIAEARIPVFAAIRAFPCPPSS